MFVQLKMRPQRAKPAGSGPRHLLLRWRHLNKLLFAERIDR